MTNEEVIKELGDLEIEDSGLTYSGNPNILLLKDDGYMFEIIKEFILQALQNKDDEWRGKVKKVIGLLENPDYQNPKAIRIARTLGKQETNHGAIAQARIDGYNVCLKEVKEHLLK